MKKRIVTVCLIIALAATAITGATLSFFTDKDVAENTFSMGNVEIQLIENFDPEEARNIVPGRNVNKDVFVKNTGTNDAYVRVHIAVPAAMDNGNFLHFDFTEKSVAEGKWSWNRGTADSDYLYTAVIDGVAYNVYTVTYGTALKPGEMTENVITNVYLDQGVDCNVHADGTVTYTDSRGNEVTMGSDDTFHIPVYAQAVQAEGFADADTAFASAYGIPSGDNNPWRD